MKLISGAMASIVLVCCMLGQEASAQRPADQTALTNLKPFSIPDLQAFIAAYPTSSYKADVEDTISLLKTFDDIRSGKVEPKCKIPFSALGHWKDGSSVWENYRHVSPDREAAGWFRKDNVAGIFNPVMGAGHSISIGSNGGPRWPSGDGSVWGIESASDYWLAPGLKVRTNGRLLLGVIYDQGLVCLKGSGTLIFPDEGNREVSIQ